MWFLKRGPNRFVTLFGIGLLCVASVTSFFGVIISQPPYQGSPIVHYKDEVTSFEEPESENIITHCVDDITQPGANVVLCFDNYDESHKVFHQMTQDTWHSDDLDETGEDLTSSVFTSSGGQMGFYNWICYANGLSYTVEPNRPYNNGFANSVSRSGQIAVEVFRLQNYDYSAGSWIIADSHCVLSNGWNDDGIKVSTQTGESY